MSQKYFYYKNRFTYLTNDNVYRTIKGTRIKAKITEAKLYSPNLLAKNLCIYARTYIAKGPNTEIDLLHVVFENETFILVHLMNTALSKDRPISQTVFMISMAINKA